MLELRPNCELCDKELPPDSTEACICTYECTFCVKCAQEVLHNVCPNCGGGFAHRPYRPANEHRKGLSLQHQPASSKRVITKLTKEEIDGFVAEVRHIPPHER